MDVVVEIWVPSFSVASLTDCSWWSKQQRQKLKTFPGLLYWAAGSSSSNKRGKQQVTKKLSLTPHSSPKWRKSARYFEIFDLLYYWLILKFRSHWTRKWVFWVISESKQCSKALRLSPVGAEILIFHFLYSIISMEGFKKVVFPKQRAPKSKIWVVQIKPYSISVAPGTLHFWASANILRVLLKLVFNLWQKFGIHFEFWTCWFDRIFLTILFSSNRNV